MKNFWKRKNILIIILIFGVLTGIIGLIIEMVLLWKIRGKTIIFYSELTSFILLIFSDILLTIYHFKSQKN